ncbi:unnamed protein product [Paramecium pentaurelia]|uniref:Uncharacterized protein n=1 Tax=Paramecium pentaurelia TaxID=43138 RepID=A0A8S1YJR1_9CILI|nr:unnamed protein product [Paramecium pentaurelia]
MTSYLCGFLFLRIILFEKRVNNNYASYPENLVSARLGRVFHENPQIVLQSFFIAEYPIIINRLMLLKDRIDRRDRKRQLLDYYIIIRQNNF